MSPVEVEFIYDDSAPIALRAPRAASSVIVEVPPQVSRASQADTAIAALVQAHGLATVGDLMAVLGIESMPRLLAMLGFTEDLPE
jgi:hypothetical protein